MPNMLNPDAPLYLLAFSVFATSFMGSIHCFGMCGPIATLTHNNTFSIATYHIGRLISYLVLGLLASLLGQSLLANFPQSLSALIAPALLSVSYIGLGIMLILKRRFHMPLPSVISRPIGKIIRNLNPQEQSHYGPLAIGLLSITLPCGWVYGFALGAATTQNIWLSELIMAMFWLGTLPSLVLSPIVFHKLINPLKKYFPITSGIILILLGFIIITFALMRVL
jgi:uncharacterized protein